MCVFHQKSYIDLLKLLITSISEKANVNNETTDILIITSPAFQPLIQKDLDTFELPIHYHLLDLHTLMESSCCKLKIFQYEHVDRYDKILYLDTDVLVNSDVNVLFNTEISPDKLHALEEGEIGHPYWGGQFFDFTNFERNTPAFSAGVFYFLNSPSMKQLFADTNAHIANYTGPTPVCLDQPFLVYNSIMQNKCDIQFMKKYLENNPSSVSREKIIYHFPGGPGDFSSKWHKMTAFWEKMKYTIFETRNDMLTHFCSTITNPKLLEIGVFRGEFLEFLVTQCGSIDAVDLFQGVTCSGNADGNNVVHYDVGRAYLELLTKYREMSNVRIIQSHSVSFLQSQEDNTYDIIYLDGDHSYKGVKNDLFHAFRKIKNNGYIMGHDYEMNMKKAHNAYSFGVKQAVDEFCLEYGQTILAKALDGCVSYCIRVHKHD